MGNYKMVLQYEGTRYQGWQKQESTENTIQGKLERLLGRLSGQTVEVQASGRTDAGVHAWGQVANFHMDTELSPQQLMEQINSYLPEDIGVISLELVPDRFHSRLHAKGKTYRYRVLNSSIPHIFDRKYVYCHPEPLNLADMRQAAALLEGTHDFAAFTSAKRNRKSTVRTVDSIRIETVGDEVVFTFSGNGFLFHMVRILVGTLLEVGEGKRGPEQMTEILARGERQNAGAMAPACGLALMEVRY